MPHFTLVGATTRAGLLTAPLARALRHRAPPRLLRRRSLEIIVRRSSDILGIPSPPTARTRSPAAPRGTPRIANRLLRRVRDFAEVKHEGRSTWRLRAKRSEMLEVDEFGLDEIDRKLLTTIIERFSGGPVGVNALASSIAEDRGTIEDLYEPYLIQIGFLQRTPRGRVASKLAYDHLGYPASLAQQNQSKLF